jgi:hypothetical protein
MRRAEAAFQSSHFVTQAIKKVITMAHLGHEYEYVPFDHSWGQNDFDDDISFDELIELGHELKKKYTVWLVAMNIDGRGYNSTIARDMNDAKETEFVIDHGHDFVLFVFGL